MYKNYNSSFQELLDKDNSITIHHRNLQRLAVEMYKVKKNISPIPMQELFTAQANVHGLRNKRCWYIPNVRTVGYGTETIIFRWPKTWELVPTEIKVSKSLQEFKAKIKVWKAEGCTCSFYQLATVVQLHLYLSLRYGVPEL